MKLLLIIFTCVVVATIGFGIRLERQKYTCSKKIFKKALALNIFSVVLLSLVALIPNISLAMSMGADYDQLASMTKNQAASGMGYLAAALSTGLACVGAGIAVGQAGSAAVGAISEDSSILGRTLIILGLAEGIAIYGLVISIMILTSL